MFGVPETASSQGTVERFCVRSGQEGCPFLQHCSFLFFLSTVGAISCAYSQQREENENEGEDLDTHLSSRIPVKISKENCTRGIPLSVYVQEWGWGDSKKDGQTEKEDGFGIYRPECLFCLKTVHVAVSSAGSGFQHLTGDEITSCLVDTRRD